MVSQNELLLYAAEDCPPDPEFDKVKKALPEYRKALKNLEAKSQSQRLNAAKDYKKHDLRGTIFEKLVSFFINQILVVRIILEDERFLKKIAEEEAQSIRTDATGSNTILLNFVRYPMRSLRDESIEMIEHLIASILEAKKIKSFSDYWPFSKMLEHAFISNIIGPVDHDLITKIFAPDKSEEDIEDINKKKCKECCGRTNCWTDVEGDATFLKCWANERNTRHRDGSNYEKTEQRQVNLISMDTNCFPKRLDRFLNIVQKIISDPSVKTIGFSDKEEDPLYDDLS